MALIHKKRGFTLVELLIVITIIGILAAALIPQVTGAQAKSRDTGRVTAVNGLRVVMTSFNNDTGAFPDALQISAFANCLSATGGLLNGTASGVVRALLPSGTMPVDPQATRVAAACTVPATYGYRALNSAEWTASGAYVIVANVEQNSKANSATGGTILGQTTLTGVQNGFMASGPIPAATADANGVYVVLGS